jgi:hypothetical protein
LVYPLCFSIIKEEVNNIWCWLLEKNLLIQVKTHSSKSET